MDNMVKMMQEILAQMNANAKANQEDMLTKMAADKEEILARMKEEARQANQEFLAKMDAYYQKRMAMLDVHQKRTMACFGQTEATDFKVNPEKMQPNPEENEAIF
jgi:hypothetical protein